MELRLMRYFVAVAEELNFSRAAERLNMAQPPLSQQIKALETMIGVQLFKRNNRKVELTEPGMIFLEEARNTLHQADKAVKAAQLAQEGQIGRLTIGFVGSATDGVFTNKLKAFRDNYPLVQLTLKEMTSAQQLNALISREIHVGVLRTNPHQTEIQSEVFTTEPLVLVLPQAHRLASARRISIHEVAGDSFILPPRHLGPDFHDLIVGFFRSHGISVQLVQEAIQMHTIVNLVASGMGVAVVPASVRNFRRAGVTYRSFIEPPPRITLSLAWRKDADSEPLRFFLNHFHGT